ncbi:MAG: hypothetical protein L5656_04000 [Thermanaeromonas sp.]|uniref:hypothetical protein n=1 Tax=Thermanaeromonas sp. TaxID=2003697 RepID=UPI002438F4B6|nr:hypothetical protein [Thermanaeromonas sp.]MCG0277682.1 hypothetical protein [Thermanaeromonas sp.]
MPDNPRKIDEQRWQAERLGEELEHKRQEFVRSILRRAEGISAEKEKFIQDKTGSPKTPQPRS